MLQLAKDDDVTIPITPNRREPVNPSALDAYNAHPGTGLSAETIISIFREAEKGAPLRQFDLFDDMLEVDGHLRGHHEGRIMANAGQDWRLLAGNPEDPRSVDAAKLLEERLRDLMLEASGTGFPDYIEHQLMHPSYGLAATCTRWELDRGVIAPIEFNNVSHRRLAAPSPERAGEIWLINGKSAKDLIPLEPGLWSITRYKHRNPWAAGLLRTATWWSMFKRLAIRDWQVYANIFGLPYVIGMYEPNSSRKTREELLKAVQNIGTDGYAVFENTGTITIKGASEKGDSSLVYPVIAKNCDDEISKIYSGGTANTDIGDKGSYAAGSIHETRAFQLYRADAKRVEATFTRSIGRPFCVWNNFADVAPPRLHIQTMRDNFPRAQSLAIVGQMLPIDEGQIREEFGLRVPAGKGVMMPAKNPATPTTKNEAP